MCRQMNTTLGRIFKRFESSDTTLVNGNALQYRDNAEACEFLMEHVRRTCALHDALNDDNGRILIPLHKPDSSELTGEFLLYSEGSLMPAYAYHDPEKGTTRRISVDKIDESGFPWLVRFWTDQYQLSTEHESECNPSTTQDNQAVVRPRDEMSDHDVKDFYNDLQGFVTEMREADRAELRSAFESLSYSTYRNRHGGIPVGIPIRYTEISEGGDICTITVPSDKIRKNIPSEFDLYPGNEVFIDILNTGDVSLSRAQQAALPAEGIIQKISNTTLIVRLLPERMDSSATTALQKFFAGSSGSIGVAQLHNSIPFDREQAAIQTTRDSPEKVAVLTGNDPILYDATVAHDVSFPSLNEYQSNAAKRALAAEHIHCIHGPPGTGKTRTLVTLARELIRQGNRVLACAHSNQATDNLIAGTSTPETPDPDSLHAAALDDEITITRVGNGCRNPVVIEHYTGQTSGSADVVAATMSSAEQFDRNEFDIAIVDEGSQASIPASLIPFNAAKRTILAGDHKQLPPYASSELEEHEMEVSLFEHLMARYGHNISTLLKRQYRMNELIAAFPNQAFYDGTLETADRNRNWTRQGLRPLVAYNLDGEEEAARGHSRRNEAEAELVAEEFAMLLGQGIEPEEIGIITPYQGQIGAIRNALNRLDGETPSVKIDTIDSFQGSERSVIIVSFVRSNDAGRAGFLTIPDEGERRLNVALTRAQHRLVLIGNWNTLSQSTDQPSCADTYGSLWASLQDMDTVQTHNINVGEELHPQIHTT